MNVNILRKFKSKAVIITAVLIGAPGAALCVRDISPVERKEITHESFEALLSEKMDRIKDLSFRFRQDTVVAGSTQTVEAGVRFRRPDSVRVTYSSPQEQDIFLHGGSLYTYIPRIRQATKHSREDASDILGVASSVILSTGSISRLKRDYEVSIYQQGETFFLEAVPRKGMNYDLLVIEFPAATLLPQRTTVTAEHLKSVTEFSGYVINEGLDEEVFKFEPPRGTRIIELD